jgi:predicted PurR-regulated permease PerM
VSAKSSSSSAQQPFFVLLGLLLVTAFLFWAKEVLIPIALAILLTFILTPAVSALQRRGLGRILSVLVVVSLTFVLLGGITWMISVQIASLARNLTAYQGNIETKLHALGAEGGMWSRLIHLGDDMSQNLGAEQKESVSPGTSVENPLFVRLVPSSLSRVLDAAGPMARALADTFLVVVLSIFMLIQRENLRNRVVRLFGHGSLIVTTRALDEGARRISRYLIMQVVINAGFGLALSAGVFVIGLYAGPAGWGLRSYALLWGFFAFCLRFVPYVGTWLAAGLLLVFSFATLPGWGLLFTVFLLFLGLELVAANVAEPTLFGHSTGSSPVALLLAAAFWAWLWGPVGLVLSTPLTVILVVVGKYVPQLEFFEVLLGDEPALRTELTFYQRLVARDQDEAGELIEEYLQTHSTETVYEDILLPTLVQARIDRSRDQLDDDDLHYVYDCVHDVLEELAPLEQERLMARRVSAGEPVPAVVPRMYVLGCPARDRGDELALTMLKHLLLPQGFSVEVISSRVLTAELLERVSKECPRIVCIGSLAPAGLSRARYLCKRLRLQCPQLKIAVGRWGDTEILERTQQRLHAAGADFVAITLRDTRTQILPFLHVTAPAPTEPGPDAPARGSVNANNPKSVAELVHG